MKIVPEGDFVSHTDKDEHVERLDTFYIDKYEVSNAQYKMCVEAEICRPPVNSFFDLDINSNHPVTNVAFEDAKTYCSWIGGYLPNNLQWEKSARGQENFEYPWGSDAMQNEHANICDINCSQSLRVESIDDGYSQTAPVGSFSAGASSYGVEDMIGNVWEWVSDGTTRGGSWQNDKRLNKISSETDVSPDTRDSSLGFRCAKDLP